MAPQKNTAVIDVEHPTNQPYPLADFSTTSGSIVFTVATTIDGPLLDVAGENGTINLSVNGGRLDGTISTPHGTRHLDAEDTLGLDDGEQHTIGLTGDDTGIHLFVDGYEAFTTTAIGWLEAIGAHSLTVDPEEIMTVTGLQVYASPLNARAMVALAVPAQAFVEFAAEKLSTRDVKRCGQLSSGSLRARFRCRGMGQGGTIIAAGGAAGRLELVVDDGDIVYRVFQGTEIISEVRAAGHWDDGDWHDVVLTSGRGAVILYVDGYQVGLEPGAAFFADIAPLDAVTVGMNLEKARLFGEAQTAAIFSTALSDASVKRLAGVAPLKTQCLFDTGFHDSKSYRIPSLIRLESGVLLAGADRRVSIANDSPNDIDFVLRRSFDDGETWEEMATLIEYPGEGRQGASVIDSVLVQDKTTGRVFVVIDHFPGGIGQPNCAVGTGFDEQGRARLQDRDGAWYTVQADGSVLTEDGNPTDYSVDEKGNVSCAGNPAGNIYLADGVDPNQSLLTHRTSYLQVIYSDDDGATWSDPVDITAQVKEDWMRFLGTSPGNGIQISTGDKAGRLVIPIYYNHEEGTTFSCAVIYSDDQGKTWHRGSSPNDGRELFGATITSRKLEDDRGSLHESALVEGENGTLHVFMRNQHPSGCVAHAISNDGGETWSDVSYLEQLTEIFSQPNAIKIDVAGKPAILFANASRMLPFRGCGVLRLSFDDGKTWPHNRVINPRHYVYQCATQLGNGDIGLLWERETQGLFLTRIPLEWLINSRSTES